jgi:arylsulfatase A-like enzyme
VTAGAIDGAGMDSVLGAAAAAGYVALVALPLLLALTTATRGLWHAWHFGQLGLVEEDGGAPRLAAWLGVVVLASAGFAWAMFQGTWLLANETAFKPLGVSFGEPLFAVATAVVAIALSRPAARLLAALARKVDARWRLTPRRIGVVLAIALAVLGWVLWHFVIRRHIRPSFDLSIFIAPAAGVAAMSAVHVVWRHVPRAIVGGVLAIAGVGLVGLALVCSRIEPSLTLSIWGDRPLAGLAIDRLFDLDAIRARVPLAALRPVGKPGAAHPDVILITIESARADHTPPYGGSADMPALRELGAHGAVFDYAFAPSNDTSRSLPSMLTGLAPTRIKGRTALQIDPRHVMLAERLRAGGYDTAGFLSRLDDHGLARGLAHLEVDPSNAALARRARAYVASRDAHTPLFLWLHIRDDWAAGATDNGSVADLRKLYDHWLASSDVLLATLLGAFANRPPIVIVTSDHGEELGEHGQPFHATDLYDSQIQVPLVVAGPGIRANRIPETVSLTDLVPTILDLAGFVPPHDRTIDGASFADLATGRRLADPNAGTAFAAMLSRLGTLTALVHGRWKLIENGPIFELYDIHADPHERTNLIRSRPPALDELRRQLGQQNAAAHRSPFD